MVRARLWECLFASATTPVVRPLVEPMEARRLMSVTWTNNHWLFSGENWVGNGSNQGPVFNDTYNGKSLDNAVFQNCTFHEFGGTAVTIKAANNVIFDGCDVYNSKKGIQFQVQVAGDAGTRHTVRNCHVYNIDEDGILVDQKIDYHSSDGQPDADSANDTLIGEHSNVLIENNVIEAVGMNQAPGTGLYHGIYGQANGLKVIGNTIRNCWAGSGVTFRSTGEAYKNTISDCNTRCILISTNRIYLNTRNNPEGAVVKVVNNILHNDNNAGGGSGSGVCFRAEGEDGNHGNTYRSGLAKLVVAFNTMVYSGNDSGDYVFELRPTMNDRNVRVYANLWVNTAAAKYDVQNAGTIDYAYHNWTTGNSGCFRSTTGAIGSWNYRLSASAVGPTNISTFGGGSEVIPGDDIYNYQRPANASAGAVQY